MVVQSRVHYKMPVRLSSGLLLKQINSNLCY